MNLLLYPISLKGRMRRRTYAPVSIILFLLIITFRVVGMGVAADEPNAEDAAVALWLLSFPLLWLYLAASWKRSHDRGRTGWWSLLLLIPIVGFFVWLIDLVFGPGDQGPNEYGPDPRRPDAPMVAPETFA